MKPRDTEDAMLPRRITQQSIFRVLIAGFSLVILLLLAAAIVGVRNIQSIQQNAASIVREQSVTNRLIDELHSQQTALSEVFSVLARDPDSVDYEHIMAQLAEADRDIDRERRSIIVDGDGVTVTAGPDVAIVDRDRITLRQGPGRGVAGYSRSDYRDAHSGPRLLMCQIRQTARLSFSTGPVAGRGGDLWLRMIGGT